MPEEVNLSHLFPSPITRKQTGGTCHLFSATDLIEAACTSSLGTPVRISPGHLIYRHLARRLRKGDFSETRLVFARAVGDDTPLDRGWAIHTFQDLASRPKLLGEGEMQRGAEVLKTLGGSVNARRGDSPEKYREFLREQLEKLEKMIPAETQDEDVQKCQALFDPESNAPRKAYTYSYSAKLAQRLLDSGTPFTCSGGYERNYFYEDGPLQHEAVFIGYRENSDMIDQVEYLVRNHNGGPATWGWSVENCTITTLERVPSKR